MLEFRGQSVQRRLIMKRNIVLACAVALVLSSCASGMRYTTEEIQHFDPQIQEKIKKEEIALGMTYAEVRYAWGAPSTVNVLPPNTQSSERVEWIYKSLFFKSVLRFSDGRLTDIVSTEPGISK